MLESLARSTMLAAVASAAAFGPATAQNQPPVRPLGATFATSKDSLGIVAQVRALPGGRALVNDVLRRRVVLMDSTLTVVRVVADSTSSTANAYGPRPGGLIAYKGDSTLFVDPASLSMLVIDAEGKIARVMSVPRPQEVTALTSISFGTPALDAEGRLVYRAFGGMNFRRAAGPGAPAQQRAGAGSARPAGAPQMPDSAAIVRLDLATRKVDTLAWIRIPRVAMNVTTDEEGRPTFSQTINPLPVVDEWAVTSDGRFAVIRGRDYRVDWIADGAVASTGKIPFDWQRLTDEDKVALIDSVKAQRERMTAQGTQGAITFGAPGGGAAAAGPTQMVVTTRTMQGDGGPATTTTSNNVRANISFVAPSELPDYKPPFFAGAVRADSDGNIWVRTIPTRPTEGGPLYDVIDGKGELIDRVQVPAGREIRGFGPGGVVYLLARGDGGTTIEAARVR